MDTQVIVVGAGPVGLLLAGELRLGGADVVVVERLTEPTGQSRASQLNARTMEVFDQRGLLERLGPTERVGTGHFGGIPLDVSEVPSHHPGLWKVPQFRTEAMLQEWAVGLGAQLRRGHELYGLAEQDDHVRAELAGPHGPVELRASFVVGCDGEQSTVRRVVGFDFPGSDAARELLRADVSGIDVPNRRFERHEHGLAIAARRPDGVTRIMVHEFGRPAVHRDCPPTFDEVVTAWARVTGEDIASGTPEWVDAFGDASRHVTAYRRGRVLLAGDAAHLQMPAGGQALNLGVQDAANLGWKLAATVLGWAPQGLLDSYHAERHPVGARVLTNVRAQTLLLLGGPEVNAARAILAEALAPRAAAASSHQSERFTVLTTTIPTSDIDLYSDESILSPYGNYRELRELGPATWLEQYQVWVVPRYQEVYAALHDHESFSSGSGVGLTDELNRVMAGGTIASDPPEHDLIRRVLGRQLTPKALRRHQDHVQQRADGLVDDLIGRGRFDVVTDFAQTFPSSLVPDLLGWPEEGRDHLLKWASAGFNALGPMNDRTVADMPVLRSLWEFLSQLASTRNLRDGSWGANLVAAVESGEIGAERLPTLLGDFLVPSLDTTVSALASTIWLLGTHPDQWQKIRQDPSLIPNAFNEIIRYESPARGFCRLLTRDYELDGLTIPAGSRVLLLYSSANRDERHWQSPDDFDVTRSNASSHVGFGHGIHGCVGQGLARLEGHALLTSLAARVHRIDVDEPKWRLHNTIRGIASLPATLRA